MELQEIIEFSKGLKSNQKLSISIQKEMDKRISALDGPEFYEFIKKNSRELQAPIKQAIAEWARQTKQINYQQERTFLLKHFRDEARGKDTLRYMSVLAMMRHMHFESDNLVILRQWMENPTHSKQISEKIKSMIELLELPDAIRILTEIDECCRMIDENIFDGIKRHLSVQVRTLISDANFFEQNRETIDSLEGIIGCNWWPVSYVDSLLKDNMQSFKNQAEKDSQKVFNQTNTHQEPITNAVALESGKPATKINPEIKEISKSIPVEPNEQKSTNEIEVPEHITEYPVHLPENLGKHQISVLQKLINEFGRLNRESELSKSRISNLNDENTRIKETKSKLESELADARSIIRELEAKDEQRKRRIKEHEERIRLLNNRYEAEKRDLQSRLETSEHENAALKNELNTIKSQLQTEKELSHSTLQDSKYRAGMEVQSKINDIRSGIIPIYREVEEFEKIADALPDRAKMLLNIIRKIKATLNSNGVNL